MNVLVCDDKKDTANEILESLGKGGICGPDNEDDQIKLLCETDLTRELEGLGEREEKFINGKWQSTDYHELEFDNGYDIVIVDNNLASLNTKGARLTAEMVIGSIRTFTPIPYMISLNKNDLVDFDLQFLVGDYDTRADLALNTPHLAHRALWDRKETGGGDEFLPWYWPELRTVYERRRGQIDFIKDRLGEPVVSALGLKIDEEGIDFLSLNARSALCGHIDEVEAVTFRDVFMSDDRSLAVRKERETLLGAADRHNGDDEGDGYRKVIARAVAARIDFWLRRYVVGPQEVLLDVPHLVARMPFLLGDKAGEIDAWNEAIRVRESTFGMDPGLYEKHVGAAKLSDEFNDRWFQFPVFHWPHLKRNTELNELFLREAQTAAWADAVFCEDTSRFEKRGTDDDGLVVEFPTGLEGPWARRHIKRMDDYKYSPKGRLVL